MSWAFLRLIGIRGALAIVFALSTLTFYAMWKYEVGRKEVALAKYAKAEVQRQIEAREAEQRKARELAAIADKYEKDKRAADEAQRKLVADLRSGAVRLQKRWDACAAASAAERDAAARDREESAARIVRAARDADDQIRALQDVVRKDRER